MSLAGRKSLTHTVRYLRTINGGPEIDVTAEVEQDRERAAERRRQRRATKAARKRTKENR